MAPCPLGQNQFEIKLNARTPWLVGARGHGSWPHRGRRHSGAVCWKETVRPSRERWLGSRENRSYSVTKSDGTEDTQDGRTAHRLTQRRLPSHCRSGTLKTGVVQMPCPATCATRTDATDLLKSRLSEFWLDLVILVAGGRFQRQLEATKTDCCGEGQRHTQSTGVDTGVDHHDTKPLALVVSSLLKPRAV